MPSLPADGFQSHWADFRLPPGFHNRQAGLTGLGNPGANSNWPGLGK